MRKSNVHKTALKTCAAAASLFILSSPAALAQEPPAPAPPPPAPAPAEVPPPAPAPAPVLAPAPAPAPAPGGEEITPPSFTPEAPVPGVEPSDAPPPPPEDAPPTPAQPPVPPAPPEANAPDSGKEPIGITSPVKQTQQSADAGADMLHTIGPVAFSVAGDDYRQALRIIDSQFGAQKKDAPLDPQIMDQLFSKGYMTVADKDAVVDKNSFFYNADGQGSLDGVRVGDKITYRFDKNGEARRGVLILGDLNCSDYSDPDDAKKCQEINDNKDQSTSGAAQLMFSKTAMSALFIVLAAGCIGGVALLSRRGSSAKKSRHAK